MRNTMAMGCLLYTSDEYYSESGILDAQPDADGYIEIDLGKIVDYIVKEADVYKRQLTDNSLSWLISRDFPSVQL